MDNKKKYLSLDDILADEEFHIIEEPNKSSNYSARNEEERLVASFQEINDFYEKNKRAPFLTKGILEFELCIVLETIRDNTAMLDKLRGYDKFKLLEVQKKKIESLDDILDDDELDLLADDTEGLFDFKHIKKPEERAATDFVAKRKPCKDFEQYESVFKGVQNDLKNNKRQLVEFKLGNLREGAFYVHNGVLFYLEKINITKKEHYREDGTRVREDGRTRCIFENGTESNMLIRSVQKLLYDNGMVVSENVDSVVESVVEHFNNITKDDKEAGFIYVLKSKSTKYEVKSIENLYKIGYSTTSVEERVKNAHKEPTYLMAQVHIVTTYKCYNMNLQKLEQLVHHFFGDVCLNVDVFDENGKRFSPREWFIAPFDIIDEAIELIVSGKILDYKYDNAKEKIVKNA